MRDIDFVEGEIYHIFTRGVEKRTIFEDDFDRRRFATILFYLNDASGKPARQMQNSVPTLTDSDKEPMVEILSWCFMPNHFHLLVKELKEGGISAFLHRLQVSHALYFNTKYKRSGPLFSGKFKAVHIGGDKHFTHVSRYIHLNPLELFDPMWKERGYVEDKVGAEKFLKEYKWSSLPDYLEQGTKFASLIDKSMVMEYFDNSVEDYWKFISEWINRPKSELGSESEPSSDLDLEGN
ncbi:MAG: transposase [Candidatus Niyogibacteria bacterium]|nr:MAG: transposase [Candidatus Niyogibacteria bacterium]